MIPAERQLKILEILRSKGIASVSALSRELKVSEITIRRDLEQMEGDGLLERTHGGAIYNERILYEPLYSEKHLAHQSEKRAIGKAAADLVEENETLLINSGSTTLNIFRHLLDKPNLKVITSNMNAYLEVKDASMELILVGGIYRPQSNSLVGPLAMLSLLQVLGTKCFIGVDGVSLRYGMTTPNIHEAEVARTMIERTHGKVIVVADHSKLGVVADFTSAPLEKVDILITDTGAHNDFVQDLSSLGIQVIQVSPQ